MGYWIVSRTGDALSKDNSRKLDLWRRCRSWRFLLDGVVSSDPNFLLLSIFQGQTNHLAVCCALSSSNFLSRCVVYLVQNRPISSTLFHHELKLKHFEVWNPSKWIPFRECAPIPWPTGGKLLFLAAFSLGSFSGPRRRGIVDSVIIGTIQAHKFWLGKTKLF